VTSRGRGLAYLVTLAALATATAGAGVAGASSAFDVLRPASRPAPGLGGDPFRSPLSDEHGWWQEALPPTGAGASAAGSWMLREPVTRDGRLGASVMQWSAGGVSRVAGRPLRIGARLERPSWDGAWSGSAGGVSLGAGRTVGSVAARIEDLLPATSIQTRVPAVTHAGAPTAGRGGVGVRWSPSPRLRAQVTWERERLSQSFGSTLYGEPIDATLDGDRRRLGWNARLSPFRGFEVEAGHAASHTVPVGGAPARPVYALAPRDDASASEISAMWSTPVGVSALARRTVSRRGFGGEASWGGRSFAEVSHGRLDVDATLLAVRGRARTTWSWLAEAERATADVFGRGTVASWPFRGLLEQTIASRLYARADARARIHRAHLGVSRANRGAPGAWCAGITVWDASIEGGVESWRPIVLAFGRADERYDAIPIRRAQLWTMAAGGAWRTFGVEVALSFEQAVAARIVHRAVAASSGGAPEPAPASGTGASQESGALRWPGGTHVEIEIRRPF
jgi:hypothetical protein